MSEQTPEPVQSQRLDPRLIEFLTFALFYERHGRFPDNEIGVEQWQEARRLAERVADHLSSGEGRA